MHNLTKILRSFDEITLNKAEQLVDEHKVRLLNHDDRGLKLSVTDIDEDFIVFIMFGDDYSIINTICSCDCEDRNCVHIAASLLFLKRNFIRQINKQKRECRLALNDFDYYKARDFILNNIAKEKLNKQQLKTILLDNKNFTKDERAALFSLGFANYIHVGGSSSGFKHLMKPISEVVNGFLEQGYFTENEITKLFYDAVTLFDVNDFKRFLNENIAVKPLSIILQRVNALLPNRIESCAELISNNVSKILSGEISIIYETMFYGLLDKSYLSKIPFEVYSISVHNAIERNNINEFSTLLVLGCLKYPQINLIFDDKAYLYARENHSGLFINVIKSLYKLDVDQINAFFIYLLARLADENELFRLKEVIHEKVLGTKSLNMPLLLFALGEANQFEITVTNSNYRQICQIIEFANDDEKKFLTSLIVKRVEENFVECRHKIETEYEIELLFKTHQYYIQQFLEDSLSQSVDKEKRLFYLTLARKYRLLQKLNLNIYED